MKNIDSLSKKAAAFSLVVAASVGLSACTTTPANQQDTSSQETTPAPTTESMNNTPSETATANIPTGYKDGTYSVVGNYTSPGGPETIDVKITLKDGVITESDVTPNAQKPISVKMQAAFVDGYKSLVVGKNINEVKLDKVSGSSLTPIGFNDALEKVKKQAQS